jgi:hypothetical protein
LFHMSICNKLFGGSHDPFCHRDAPPRLRYGVSFSRKTGFVMNN